MFTLPPYQIRCCILAALLAMLCRPAESFPRGGGVALTLPAFFVSPTTGNDANPGTSPTTPFLTMTAAQSAMQGSAAKTTYLMAGSFLMNSTLDLVFADTGESWLGFPGQTPVLNGQNTVATGVSINAANNITLRFLTLENFTGSGIDVLASSGDLLDSNVIQNIGAPDTGHGGIYGHFNFASSSITHNLIQDSNGPGIAIASGSTSEINSNLTIAYNVVSNTNTGLTDSGAIYILDRGHLSTGQVVNNNVITTYGSSTTGLQKAIYLDDETSNVTVTNNIVSGVGQYGLQIHGGDHDVFTNNFFDISASQKLGLYQDDVSSGFPNYGMAGNVFNGNIVYSASNAPNPLWDYIHSVTIALPSVAGSIYYDLAANPGNLNVGPSIIDSSPHLVNPLFVNAAGANYNFQSGSPAPGLGINAINVSTVGPLPH